MNAETSTGVVLADCWNHIGVAGDRSCSELTQHVHCHNCPVYAAAGQRLLDRPPSPAYLDEVKNRLAAEEEALECDTHSALVFRIGEEWLALGVQALVEVHSSRPVHRIPHRGGLLAGLVNIRGELFLCARFDQLLGIASTSRGAQTAAERSTTDGSGARPDGWLLVVAFDRERWVLPVDEVDQVYRFPASALTPIPATIARASARLSRAIFDWNGRRVGYLDEGRLLEALRKRLIP